jgi:hypothetical protein
MLYEFPPQYTFDPEDTSITGLGSGVHLFEDITLTFDIIDRAGSIANNSVSINKNPFIGDMRVDVLDSSGNIVYPSYYSGAALRSFTLSKQQNMDIFGSYTKDFGILVDLADNTAGNFDSIFQLRGNLPSISGLSVVDGSGIRNYFAGNSFGVLKSTFSWSGSDDLDVWIRFLNKITTDATYSFNYGWLDDINDDPYTTVSSGGGTHGSQPGSPIVFQTNLYQAWLDGQITGIAEISGNYSWYLTGSSPASLKIEHIYDGITEVIDEYTIYPGTATWPSIYASGFSSVVSGSDSITTSGNVTGSIEIEIGLENDPQYINLTHFDIYVDTNSGVEPIFENFNKRVPIFNQSKDISFELFAEDIEYDTSYYFRVVPYSSLGSGQHVVIGPHIIAPPPKIPSTLEANLLYIREGSETGVVDLITGQINSTGNTVVDIIPVNTFRSINYITKITDSTGQISSSRLSMVITGSGVGEYYLSEYAISPNSNIVYNTSGDLDNIYLLAQTNFSPATYKFYKTSI